MKKITIFIILLLAITQAFSQFSYGMKGGPMFTRMINSDGKKDDFISSAYFGVFASGLFFERVRVSIEPQYQRKSGRSIFQNQEVVVIHTPLIVGVRPIKKLELQVGIYTEYQISPSSNLWTGGLELGLAFIANEKLMIEGRYFRGEEYRVDGLLNCNIGFGSSGCNGLKQSPETILLAFSYSINQ